MLGGGPVSQNTEVRQAGGKAATLLFCVGGCLFGWGGEGGGRVPSCLLLTRIPRSVLKSLCVHTGDGSAEQAAPQNSSVRRDV